MFEPVYLKMSEPSKRDSSATKYKKDVHILQTANSWTFFFSGLIVIITLVR